MLAAEPPAPPPPPASDVTEAAPEKVATALAASHPAPAPHLSPSMAAERQRSPRSLVAPPPLPRRKPAVPQPEPKAVVRPAEPQAAPAKQELAKQNVAPQKQAVAHKRQSSLAAAQGLGRRWRLPRRTSRRLKCPRLDRNNAAHGSQVWAALARHKPRAGMRGSATVVFSIGENGGLRGVKVGRSSGNDADRSAGIADGAQCGALPASACWRCDLYDPHRFPIKLRARPVFAQRFSGAAMRVVVCAAGSSAVRQPARSRYRSGSASYARCRARHARRFAADARSPPATPTLPSRRAGRDAPAAR